MEYKSQTTAKVQSENTLKTMHVLTLPQFIKYFRVANDDENFFEDTIDKLADLA